MLLNLQCAFSPARAAVLRHVDASLQQNSRAGILLQLTAEVKPHRVSALCKVTQLGNGSVTGESGPLSC